MLEPLSAVCQRKLGWASSKAPCVLQTHCTCQTCSTEQKAAVARGHSASADTVQTACVPPGALPWGWAPFQDSVLAFALG